MKVKRKILIGSIAAAVLVCLGVRAYGRAQKAKKMAENFTQIETVQVKKQDLADSVSVTGTIQSADEREVSANVKAVKVLTVSCQEGDYVNAGDVVLTLDTADLELELAQARNSQALSSYKENKTIETASGNYKEATEDGTDEYNKAVKAAADAKEALQEADADAEKAAESLKHQEQRYGEAQASGDQKAISEAQAEYTARHQAYNAAAEAQEKAAEAYENAVEALEDAKKKNERNLSDAADSLEQAQMEHTYSNNSSERTIENLQEQINGCTVVSPISGVITAMNVAVGDTYQGEGSVLFCVADNERFVVAANVDEYDIGSIQKDMEAAVIVEAVGEEELPASVSFVSPSAAKADTGSSSYAVEIALDDANTNMRIGMTAKASIVQEAVHDVLTVPYDCVETDENGRSFLYVDKNGEKEQVFVQVGMESDYYIEVSGEGLEEGMMVYYPSPMVNQPGTNGQDEEAGEMTFDMMPAGGLAEEAVFRRRIYGKRQDNHRP